MNVKQIAVILGAPSHIGAALAQAAEQFGVKMTDHWLAQIYVESDRFRRVRENLAYRPERLLEVFKGRNGMDTLAEANAACARGRDGIAEVVYGLPWGAKNLGNTKPGDGARFIGRGYKQLTGRDNYTRYSLAMYGDDRIVREPTMLELLPDAALSAAWFWKDKKIDACGDDIEAVTRKVNGGLNGLADRRTALAKIRRVV